MLKKVLLPQAEEARNDLHISEQVMMEVDSKAVLIMSNVFFFNWNY